MNEKLKPCPFCGEKPELVEGYALVSSHVYRIEHDCGGVDGLYIKSKIWSDREHTVEMWNRRASDE